TRPHQGPPPWPIGWGGAKTNSVLNILQNPAYAGVYVWGKSTTDPARRTPGVAHSDVVRLPPDQWQFCVASALPTRLSSEQFPTAHRRVPANHASFRPSQPGAPRLGQATPQAIALSGRCGAWMWVRYRGPSGERTGYVSNTNAIELGEPRCQEVNAADVDPI